MVKKYITKFIESIHSFVKSIIKELNFKYDVFVNEHSLSIQKLNEINNRYRFEPISNHNMFNFYDNEIFYNEISPEDYLVYQLVYKKKEILKDIETAEKNKSLFNQYIIELNGAKLFGAYDSDDLPKNIKKLNKIEKRIFNDKIQRPYTRFTLVVKLTQTNIIGVYIDSKAELFDGDRIKSILLRMKNKNNDFYLDKGIWDSICKVERGRVSNKVRFAIYKRDNYRCVKCGRKNTDLEVDHIFPIAKGGKSNFDNLQTLCSRCNALKSDNIEEGATDPRAAKKKNYVTNELCPSCNIPLIIRHGKYGDFYGCNNYPKCTYTKQIK